MTTEVIPACPEELAQAVKPTVNGIDHLIIDPVQHTEMELPEGVELVEDHPITLLLEEIHELTDHMYWKQSELTDLITQEKKKEKMARLRGLVKKGGTSDE